MSAEPPKPADQEDASPTLWQTAGSVLASFFGVQSSRNRKRDFTRGNPLHFIVIGVLITLGFVGTLTLIIKLVLHNAGV